MGKRKRNDPPRKDGRPKRSLVRWDPDIDAHLLLSVQAACNANQIKIPWDKVASIMGDRFTDGSIIQHLSKLRVRREAEGKPCPPPLRRSNTPMIRKPVKGSARKGKKASDTGRFSLRAKAGGITDSDDDDDDWEDDDGEEIVESDEEGDPEWPTVRRKPETGGPLKMDPKMREPRLRKISPQVKPSPKRAAKGKKTINHDDDSDSTVRAPAKATKRLSSRRSKPPAKSSLASGDPSSPTKIVTFDVPPQNLRNLELTGSVYHSSAIDPRLVDPVQPLMPPQQSPMFHDLELRSPARKIKVPSETDPLDQTLLAGEGTLPPSDLNPSYYPAYTKEEQALLDATSNMPPPAETRSNVLSLPPNMPTGIMYPVFTDWPSLGDMETEPYIPQSNQEEEVPELTLEDIIQPRFFETSDESVWITEPMPTTAEMGMPPFDHPYPHPPGYDEDVSDAGSESS
ncbi:hypothetical protein N7492_004522 [Penicillium capsulatum]|uniref:Myb-like domain-containing protein n=1 Tax=Penicillium capsulatum TaxID=69766 RepID=A0A9W9I7T0_9EURO|nr:hypothetical protein N7492_004522 [Penicillium capsulatum]KAJ6136358.1 hypothetical protein N7512_001518 [Penicillium capsulatum]